MKKPRLWNRGVATGRPGQKPDRKKITRSVRQWYSLWGVKDKKLTLSYLNVGYLRIQKRRTLQFEPTSPEGKARGQGCQVIMRNIRVHVWKVICRRPKNPYVGNMGIKIKGKTSTANNFFTAFPLNIWNIIFFKFFWHSYHKIKIHKHKIMHHTTARIRPYLYTSAPHLWSSTMKFTDC